MDIQTVLEILFFTIAGFFLISVWLAMVCYSLSKDLAATRNPGEQILTVGDPLICQTLDHNGHAIAVQLVVSEQGTISLPYNNGDSKVAGLQRSHIEAWAGQASRKLFATWQRDRESELEDERDELIAGALQEVNQSLEIELKKIRDIPKALDWAEVHDHCKLPAIEFHREGAIIQAHVLTAPTGRTLIEWSTRISNAIPYWVVVKQDGQELLCEQRYLDYVSRHLTPGVDYTFSFEVYRDPPTQRRKSHNLEPSFRFIVNVPTAVQWTGSRKKRPSKAKKMLRNIKTAVTEKKNVEKAIDQMGLDADETLQMKAKYVASTIRSLDEAV
jgi:hypothetical protein